MTNRINAYVTSVVALFENNHVFNPPCEIVVRLSGNAFMSVIKHNQDRFKLNKIFTESVLNKNFGLAKNKGRERAENKNYKNDKN